MLTIFSSKTPEGKEIILVKKRLFLWGVFKTKCFVLYFSKPWHYNWAESCKHMDHWHWFQLSCTATVMSFTKNKNSGNTGFFMIWPVYMQNTFVLWNYKKTPGSHLPIQMFGLATLRRFLLGHFQQILVWPLSAEFGLATFSRFWFGHF